jgi:hypothetical protein
MSKIFMLNSHLGILYGIGADNRLYSEGLYASIARPDPRSPGGLRTSLHSSRLASRSSLDSGRYPCAWKENRHLSPSHPGLAQERHFTNYHRDLNRAVWHASFTAKVSLGRMVALFPPAIPLQILVDETMERRKGAKIKTKGVFRDAVRSSCKKVVHCYGLRLVAMMLLVQVPWSRHLWALPFFTVQAPSEKTCSKLGKPHKGVIDRVCLGLRLVQRWIPQRALIKLTTCAVPRKTWPKWTDNSRSASFEWLKPFKFNSL